MGDRICTSEGCNGRVVARDMCTKHYQRWVKDGKPGYIPKSQLPVVLCAVDDCDRPIRKREWCNRHYENVRRYGRAVPVRDLPLKERLELVGWDVTESGCWEWRGVRNDNGYGLLSAPRHELDHARVHRLMYELHVGPLGELMACHRCDNPPCVNPSHIFPGTGADNMADMSAKGRHWKQGRTECPNGHDLTLPDATRMVARAGKAGPICVPCDRARKRRWEEKQRSA
ncbi:HNH endonuclease [Streptosporangium sp. NPDC023963]|jgi:hypothetical protein|uniref:HNH endonuclease n=1 Tax=Streptosporangium sp. NPDC023963 TaxID=3155608 RepID=UPI00343F9DE3